MRANQSLKAFAVLVASTVPSARANLRATAATEMKEYIEKIEKGEGSAVDSDDGPGPSYGRAIKDLYGSAPVLVEHRCSESHEYRLISEEECRPAEGAGHGMARNLKPGEAKAAAAAGKGCSCVQTVLPTESAK